MANSLVDKLRGFFGVHDGGDVSDVKDMTERMFEWEVVSPLLSGTSNTSFVYAPGTNCKLVNARFIATAATANTEANTVFLAVNTNGVEVANVNTDAASLDALAINDVADLSVNTSNSAVEADELVGCYVNHQSANNCNGYFLLTFRQED
jgi:hypothetical protein